MKGGDEGVIVWAFWVFWFIPLDTEEGGFSQIFVALESPLESVARERERERMVESVESAIVC